MGSDLVAMVPPLIDRAPSFLNESEQVLIHAFVHELAIEALTKSNLGRRAGPHKLRLYPSISGPEASGVARELSALAYSNESDQAA